MASQDIQPLGAIWRLAEMPPDALDRVTLTGARPLLASSFRVGEAARTTIACAALAATEVGRLRGVGTAPVSVDMHDAERECTGYFRIDDKVPQAWAPLSGLYPCADGFVRIHANFDHHRDGALALLGLDLDPAWATRADVERALSNWQAEAFESAAAERNLVVAAARDFDAWDRLPQAQAISHQPLLTIEKIGDAPPRTLPLLTDPVAPLSGVRVLDLTRILAGPVCGKTLAAYGADVMLVNSPHLPNIESIIETSRGKRSVLVDLHTAQGVAALGALVQGSHVFIQGYRPGGLDGLGFGPQAVAARCPGVVYVSLSAYGSLGPWAGRRGFDSLVQTAAGFNLAEAQAFQAGMPRALPVQILDYASGFLMAFGTSVALSRQQREGGSWHVRVSLAQTAHWLRGLGRLEDNLQSRKIDPGEHAASYDSGYGRLVALPHAARIDGRSTRWSRLSNPPGTDLPAW